MGVVPHNRLTFGEAECEAVSRTLRSGQWAQGPKVEELEQVLAQVTGVSYAVCVGSGLAALRLSLGALGLDAEDRVLVPGYSCVAVANAVMAWGAVPVPIEIESGMWTIDPNESRREFENLRPKAAIAINTFGAPAAMAKLDGISWIEDCAHAFGATAGGKALGSRAEIGVLSFYATKLIGGGEGGAVLTNSSQVADFVRLARDYGDQPADAHRMNDKMTDLEAAIVLAQLERLPSMLQARAALAGRYIQHLGRATNGEVFRLPGGGSQRIWYRFAVEMLSVSADTIVDALRPLGIQAAVPITDWRIKGGYSTPIADRAYRSLVSLPLYPTLGEREQDLVIAAFLKVCGAYNRG